MLRFRYSLINKEKIRGARKDVQFADCFDKIDMNNLSRHAPVTKLSVRDWREKSEINGRLLLITRYRQSLPLNRESFRHRASPQNISFPSREIRYFRLLFTRPFVTSNYFRASHSHRLCCEKSRRYRHNAMLSQIQNHQIRKWGKKLMDRWHNRQWSMSRVFLFIRISNFISIKFYHIVLLNSYVFTISINSHENLFACQLFLLLKENYVIHLRI